MAVLQKKVSSAQGEPGEGLELLHASLERLTELAGDVRWISNYSESHLHLLHRANALLAQLPQHARACWQGPWPITQEPYAERERNSQSKLEEQWEKLGPRNGESLESYIGRLKTQGPGKDFRRRLWKVFPLLPLFFTPSGARRPKPQLKVAPEESDSFQTGLGAALLETVSRMKGLGDFAICLARDERLRKKSRSEYVGNLDRSQYTRLSLVRAELPAAFFRGAYGDDCALQTVPLYPILQGVRTYWIVGENESSTVLGYALTVDVTLGKEVLPLVLTIAGKALSGEATRRVIRLLAADFETSVVLVPPVSVSLKTYGGARVRAEMKHLARGTPLPIHLPSGWEIIDKYHFEWHSRESTGYFAWDLPSAVKIVLGSPQRKTGILRVAKIRRASNHTPFNLYSLISTMEISIEPLRAKHFPRVNRKFDVALARLFRGAFITSKELLSLERTLGPARHILQWGSVDGLWQSLRSIYAWELSVFAHHRKSQVMRSLQLQAYRPVDPCIGEIILSSSLTSRQARRALNSLRGLAEGSLKYGPSLLRDLSFLPPTLKAAIVRPNWL